MIDDWLLATPNPPLTPVLCPKVRGGPKGPKARSATATSEPSRSGFPTCFGATDFLGLHVVT
jgi:hypothetical protein